MCWFFSLRVKARNLFHWRFTTANTSNYCVALYLISLKSTPINIYKFRHAETHVNKVCCGVTHLPSCIAMSGSLAREEFWKEWADGTVDKAGRNLLIMIVQLVTQWLCFLDSKGRHQIIYWTCRLLKLQQHLGAFGLWTIWSALEKGSHSLCVFCTKPVMFCRFYVKTDNPGFRVFIAPIPTITHVKWSDFQNDGRWSS